MKMEISERNIDTNYFSILMDHNETIGSTEVTLVSEKSVSDIYDNGESLREEFWIGDSGASHHMRKSPSGFYNKTNCDHKITLGDGKTVEVEFVGDVEGEIIQVDGKTIPTIIKDVSYVPGLQYNLFSTTKAISAGMELFNEGTIITLELHGYKIRFDRIFNMQKGFVSGFKFIPKVHLENNLALATGVREVINDPVGVNSFHQKLGHTNLNTTKCTAQAIGITLTGEWKHCLACVLAKAKQKKISKINENKRYIPGERVYTDISYISGTSLGGKNYWVLIVDEATRFKISGFVKHKSDMADFVVNTVKHLKNQEYKVTFIRCDRSGENLAIKNEIVQKNVKSSVDVV